MSTFHNLNMVLKIEGGWINELWRDSCLRVGRACTCKEGEFANEILSKGLILDSEVERLDFVHGFFDFIIVFKGKLKEIDLKIIEMRKSRYIRKTQTLICFEMFNWDWKKIKSKINEEK